jgi:hypothetical protein
MVVSVQGQASCYSYRELLGVQWLRLFDRHSVVEGWLKLAGNRSASPSLAPALASRDGNGRFIISPPPPAPSQSPITLAVVFGATVVETPGTGSRRRGGSEQGTSLP